MFLYWLLLKYWLWLFATKLVLGVIYLSVIAEGLRYLVPALGQRLHKLPLLSSLQDYEETHRLDLAPFFALFLLIAVWYLWERVLHVWLASNGDIEWKPEELLIFTLGTVILGSDGLLFYISMTTMGWGGSIISISAFLASLAYIAVLIFVSYVTINLRDTISLVKGEVKHVA
jgi:hypothetical protein